MLERVHQDQKTKKATIYRMVTPEHTCPYGLKATHLLKSAGYGVEDIHLKSREETDRWDGLKLFLTDGRVEIDNNSVERTIRPIALNRKNALFAGHDTGAENWATIASLIETCKLNSVDPLAYLSATLNAIVNGHRQSQIEELLPWHYRTR